MAFSLFRSLVAVFVFAGVASGDFLSPKRDALATVLNATLRQVMDERNAPEEERKRFLFIESSIARTFQAMPKTGSGRVMPKAVRHVVNGYFAHEHGMYIEGLSGHDTQSGADVSDAAILERSPALVESMLEESRRGRGLSFEDLVAMIATLERLIFDEATQTLERIYDLNKLDVASPLDLSQLEHVLRTYLISLRYGLTETLTPELYQHYMSSIALLDTWPGFKEFAHEAAQGFMFMKRDQMNPFRNPLFNFEATSKIVFKLANQFGKWQDGDCQIIKSALMNLDVASSGRVPLDKFYAEPHTAYYRFHESTDYLRGIGALEEAKAGQKRVRISNYIHATSNCISHSDFFSICCRNECTELLHELEGHLQAPVAHPDDILRFVADLESSTVDAPRELSDELVKKLHHIASQNAGGVPLHGRLFAQWLFYAFPNECPYPLPLAMDKGPRDVKKSKSYIASKSEIDDEMQMQVASAKAEEQEDSIAEWSDEETLPFSETTLMSILSGFIARPFGILSKLALLAFAFRAAFTSLGAATSAFKGTTGDIKKSFTALV
eukprot:TRINITY_DN18604_c0_g1_i1.p2 TRINITY_DN18604_c0_g1~~TRINITY_DN18604_c0_g1_i1.p2  ORF type:complete len:554 (+),score=164.55 TRINITY_DN18604_c0_g1_i1:101-1762(+)